MKKSVLYIFFGLFYFIGTISFRNYGINWDDFPQHAIGLQNYDYIFRGYKEALQNSSDKYYGPFIEVLLVIAEKTFNCSDLHTIFLLHHFILFNLFFLSVIVFHSILRTHFNPILSLIGCLFLVLSPRIFAESFYNSKDLGFLCFLIYAVYTMLKFIQYKNYKWLIIHALISAAAIDVRILGIMIPPLTISIYVFDIFYNKVSYKKLLLPIVYIGLLIIFVITFFPFLWNAPFKNFIAAYNQMKQYPWNGNVYFIGKEVSALNLPWYYIPVWILITTPALYSILFFIGICSYVGRTLTEKLQSFNSSILLHISFALIAFPFLSVIFFHSTLYDGWRHFYFIYPFFIVFALTGLYSLQNIFEKRKTAIAGVLLVNSFFIGFWMYKNHPFQNTYFNLTSRVLIDAGNKFEKDYWGLSYKQGLEYLAKIKSETPIKISAQNPPCEYNLLALDNEIRSKFVFCDKNSNDWEYYLTIYRYNEQPPSNLTKIYTINVDGYSIMGIYKR